jgi:hypothetical protein
LNSNIVGRYINEGRLRPRTEMVNLGNIVSRFVGASMITGDSTYHLSSVRFVINTQNGYVIQGMKYDELRNVKLNTGTYFFTFA